MLLGYTTMKLLNEMEQRLFMLVSVNSTKGHKRVVFLVVVVVVEMRGCNRKTGGNDFML